MTAEILLLISVARNLASFLIICCLPGLAASYLLFPSTRLKPLERVFVACCSSIAISSLLAAGLILIHGQINPVNFFVGLLTLIAIFTAAALWRKYLDKLEIHLLSTFSPDIRRKFTNSRWLLAGLVIFSLSFLLVVQISRENDPIEDRSALVNSGVTEFYVSPQVVEQVLESIDTSQGEIEIPLEIVNHNPDMTEFRIELFSGSEKISEKTAIIIAAGETWQGVLTAPGLISNNSDHVDILLLNTPSQKPVSQLRLWK